MGELEAVRDLVVVAAAGGTGAVAAAGVAEAGLSAACSGLTTVPEPVAAAAAVGEAVVAAAGVDAGAVAGTAAADARWSRG